mgnify:FL=1
MSYMCSLEDRTKQHYIFPYDPEYVKDMIVEGFDPHLDLAVSSKAMNEVESLSYKNKTANKEERERLSLIRYAYKGGNYGCTYGAYPPRLARELGIPKKLAQNVFDTFWGRNWSIKAIADNTKTKTVQGVMWLYNPVSKLWYYLKTEKDKFSTLNQGTASFLFDMWVKEIRTRQPKIKLCGQFHDEVILQVKVGYREQVTALLKDSVASVNNTYKLNRDLDVDVDFSENYAGVH